MVQVGSVTVGKVSMLVSSPASPPDIMSPVLKKLYEIHIYEMHMLIQQVMIVFEH